MAPKWISGTRSASRDVLQLLTLLTGDAVVGEQHEISGADDFLLGVLDRGTGPASLSSVRRLPSAIWPRPRCAISSRDRAAGLVPIDLLDSSPISLVLEPPSAEPATAIIAFRISRPAIRSPAHAMVPSIRRPSPDCAGAATALCQGRPETGAQLRLISLLTRDDARPPKSGNQ